MLEAPTTKDGAFLRRAHAEIARREAAHRSDPAWLRARRARAASALSTLGLPGPKTEAWRFTSLRGLEKLAGADATAPRAAQRALPPIDSRAHLVVMRNGRFDAAASRLEGLPRGAAIARLEDALPDERPEARFGALASAEQHAFNALSEAAFEGGVLVRLEAGVALEQPLHVVHVLDAAAGADEAAFAQARALVILERGASARVLEHFAGPDELASFANPVTELSLQPGARLDYARLQDEGRRTIHLGRVAARLERDALLRALSVAWGGQVARAEFTVELAGEGAECALDGLYLPTTGQHHDHTLSVRHLAPRTLSRQSFRGILAGAGRAVFRGSVYVAPDAQKIDARQTNKNLLLSPRAWIDTLPQLEIHADDVKCSHGATIGRLDLDALHYMRSRGLGVDEARALLTFAFANEILGEIAEEALREELAAKLRTWLATRGQEGENA